MKIKNFSVTSSGTIDYEVCPQTSICVLVGKYSSLALDLMREMIGDHNAINSPDRIEDGRFVIYGNVEIKDKNYSVSYIRNADFMGDKRLAVNFKPCSTAFSLDDTKEYLDLISSADNCNNVFDKMSLIKDMCLSEGDRRLLSFNNFIDRLLPEDKRPLFIYDFFEYLDESIDVATYVERLIATDRQVFISVCDNYSKEKLKNSYFHVVDLEACDFGGYYSSVECPICGKKTLDNYWICSRCGWEYDGFEGDAHYSTANQSTIADYRKKYNSQRGRENV